MMAGSTADVPKDLLEQIRRLEDMFTVDTKKLKDITAHFVTELAKGIELLSLCQVCSPILILRAQVSVSKVVVS